MPEKIVLDVNSGFDRYVKEKNVKRPKMQNVWRHVRQEELDKLKELKYADFLPIHTKWKEHMKGIMGKKQCIRDERLVKVRFFLLCFV